MGILTVGERTQPTLPGVEEATTPTDDDRRELPLEDQRAVGVDHHAVVGRRRSTPGTHVMRAIGDRALPRLRRHHAAGRLAATPARAAAATSGCS